MNEKYHRYLCSREWGLRRKAIIERSGGRCERCIYQEGIHVHHLTYARLYNEPLTDLQLLCEECHKFLHGKSNYDPLAIAFCYSYQIMEIVYHEYELDKMGYYHVGRDPDPKFTGDDNFSDGNEKNIDWKTEAWIFADEQHNVKQIEEYCHSCGLNVHIIRPKPFQTWKEWQDAAKMKKGIC